MNKKISITIFLLMICICTINTSAAAYSHTSEIKLSCPGCPDIGNDHIDNEEFSSLAIYGHLYVDGREKWYRWLNYNVIDENGNRLHEDTICTVWPLGGVYWGCNFLKVGKYRLVIQYDGNEMDGYPPAIKVVNLNVKPSPPIF